MVAEPDEVPDVEVPAVSGEDDFFAFLAFLCLLDFLAFGWVSVPAALLPASVPDAPELADGLAVLEPEVSLELCPGIMPVVPPDALPDAPLPPVPDAPDVLSLGEGALLPLVPEVPEAPLLMPDDVVPLAAEDDGDDGDDDIVPLLSCELEVEGLVALLPLVLVSAPLPTPAPCASAMDDTDATRTNDNDWIEVFNVMSNSLGWKIGIIDAAAWISCLHARSPAFARHRRKFQEIFYSPLKRKDFLTM